MGVDHGLQGKEGIKSREKRQKRAQRAHKLVGKVGIVVGKKKELVFNETARTEWLTGFHKRKLQRRQYGLTMGLLKEKKAVLDMRKQRRKLMSTTENSDLTQNDEDDNALKTSTETCFDDDSTNAMFGGDVSVVIDTGIVDEMDDMAHPDADGAGDDAGTKGASNARREATAGKARSRFDVAAQKAKQKMRHKPGRSGGKKRLQRSANTRLLHKVLGSGVLGSNEYKGGKKHRRSG